MRKIRQIIATTMWWFDVRAIPRRLNKEDSSAGNHCLPFAILQWGTPSSIVIIDICICWHEKWTHIILFRVHAAIEKRERDEVSVQFHSSCYTNVRASSLVNDDDDRSWAWHVRRPRWSLIHFPNKPNDLNRLSDSVFVVKRLRNHLSAITTKYQI